MSNFFTCWIIYKKRLYQRKKVLVLKGWPESRNWSAMIVVYWWQRCCLKVEVQGMLTKGMINDFFLKREVGIGLCIVPGLNLNWKVPRYLKAGIRCTESDTPVFTCNCGARLTLRVLLSWRVLVCFYSPCNLCCI